MAYYIGSVSYGDRYLTHHGIKGMKWGVRRFENADGTLTAEGRRRYGDGEGGGRGSRLKRFAKVAGTTAAAVGGAYAISRGLKSGKIGGALRKASYKLEDHFSNREKGYRKVYSADVLRNFGQLADDAGFNLRQFDRSMKWSYERAKETITSTVKSTADRLIHRYGDKVLPRLGQKVTQLDRRTTGADDYRPDHLWRDANEYVTNRIYQKRKE